MTVTYTVGDTRDVIKGIADGSVDLIASSPPFLALRSYVPADHHAKGDEIGSERNPAEFIDMLLGLTVEWGRVLAPHGSIAIELGDTYSGGPGSGDLYVGSGDGFNGSAVAGNMAPPARGTTGWPRAKSLALIPQLYAVALAYGINPLTGAPSPAGRWLVRNVIVWHRPNPAVGALGDKVRPSTSYIVVATRSAKRWFDLTAVRTRPQTDLPPAVGNNTKGSDDGSFRFADRLNANSAGAPPLDTWFDPYDGTHDTWTLTTQPSRLAHYAMWPAKLAERLILSMCPAQVCRICGEPRRRVEGDSEQYAVHKALHGVNGNTFGERPTMARGRPLRDVACGVETLGWTDCGHGTYRPGVVLDPFGGSGTTGAVADLHGRDATLIDFDARNKAIYPARYDEVSRALFGTKPELPGQLGIFDEVPA